MYGLISSKESLSADPVEDIEATNLRFLPGRNRSKQKHDENTIYEPREIRGIIYYKVSYQKEGTGRKRVGDESGVATPPGGAARGGLTPQGGVGHPGSGSVPFSLRSFPY